MKDRISNHPGRVRLTPVAGQANVYDMGLEDSPIEQGTALNKANLLTDATANALRLTGNPTVNDALAAIATGKANIETGSYTGTGTYGTSNRNTLTFSFTPKIVCIAETGGTDYFPYMVAPYIWGTPHFVTITRSSYYEGTQQNVTVSNNTMQWYSNGGNADYQLNTNGKRYNYVAIG